MTVQNPFIQLKIKYFLLNLVFNFITIYVICILIANLINSNFDSNDSIVDYISYIIFCIVFCFWLQRKLQQNQIDIRNIFGKFSIDCRLVIRLFVLITFFLLFSFGILMLTLSLISLTLPSFMESLIKDISSTKSQLFPILFFYPLLEIFAYVIIGPVAEEFIFRGVLLHIWAAKHKVGLSILMSSLVFGLFHIHPIVASIKGIFYTLLYIKYRSLFVSILAHVINNAVVTVAPFFLEQVISGFNDIPTLDEVTNLWKIGLLLTFISIPFAIRFIYRQWPSASTLMPYFANIID
jgi:uncharacterized protein